MSDEYFKIIRSTKTIEIPNKSRFSLSPGESPIGVTVIPRMCADIRFKIGSFKMVEKKFSQSEEEKNLPLNWNNFTQDENDNDMDRALKQLSIRPQNQGLCGSCYAVSTATTISDNFLFGMKMNESVSVSPMYILSCLTNEKYGTNGQNVMNKCGGGNPSGIVDYIIKSGGIVDDCSLDYYKICSKNEYCGIKGKGTELENAEKNVNSMIPNCGHCNDNPLKMYRIKNKTIAQVEMENPDQSIIVSAKNHIHKYGAAIAGFAVYKNFQHGNFDETAGIYIKDVDYNKDGDMSQLGFHAISIVGWGVSENVNVEFYGKKYVYPKIEYWVCRNSWTEKWGTYGGYFRYAFYQRYEGLPEINKGVAMETNNIGFGSNLGGLLLIEPDAIVDPLSGSEILNKVECVEYKCDAPRHVSVKKIESNKKRVKSPNIFIQILFVCLLLIALICLKKIFGKKLRK